MYIQITDKCNMLCDHCGFSCTAEGSFMKLDVFKAALDVAMKYDSHIVIGGGEPCLHPHFEKFLLLAIAAASKMGADYKVFIVTNGSIKERAMMIAQLSAANVIDGRLSYDQFHDLDMVSEEVIAEFRRLAHLWGPIGRWFDNQKYAEPVRDTARLSKRGRAVQFEEAQDTCVCEDILVKPNGNIHQCGCQDAPQLGHVLGNYDICCNSCCKELAGA